MGIHSFLWCLVMGGSKLTSQSDDRRVHGSTVKETEQNDVSCTFITSVKGKASPYSITERRVPELIPVLGSQPAGDVSHKPGGTLPLLSARPAVTPATLKRAATSFCCLLNKGTTGVNSLPKTVTRQRRDCDLNPGPSAPESSTPTTRLPTTEPPSVPNIFRQNGSSEKTIRKRSRTLDPVSFTHSQQSPKAIIARHAA